MTCWQMAQYLHLSKIIAIFAFSNYQSILIMADKNQQGTGIGTKTRERVLIEEPRQYKVIFYNDDFTTMEFVAHVLQVVFGKPANDAILLMLKVHREGQAVVGVYTYDVAMTKAAVATAMARDEGYPLKIVCIPE